MTPQQFLTKLNMADVCQHYTIRSAVHTKIRSLFESGEIDDFAQLALGIADAAGNYSAAEHRRGPRILSENGADDVFDLARAIDSCRSPHYVPETIYKHDLSCLKIGVGSEIAMMLRPNDFWVGNRRTIWCHLLVRHGWNASKANGELALYFQSDDESEMDYAIWRDIYLAEEPHLIAIGELGSAEAVRQGQTPGTKRFLWPDALATYLFDQFAAKKTKGRTASR